MTKTNALWIATAVCAALLPCCMETPCTVNRAWRITVVANASACTADELDWVDVYCYTGDTRPGGAHRTYVSVLSGWSEPFEEPAGFPSYDGEEAREVRCDFVGSAGQEYSVLVTDEHGFPQGDVEHVSGDPTTCSDETIYDRVAVTLPWCDAPD